MIAIVVHDGVHAAFSLASDKECPLLSERHASRVFHIARVRRDGKSWRQLEAMPSDRVSAQALGIEKHQEDHGYQSKDTTRHGISGVTAPYAAPAGAAARPRIVWLPRRGPFQSDDDPETSGRLDPWLRDDPSNRTPDSGIRQSRRCGTHSGGTCRPSTTPLASE